MIKFVDLDDVISEILCTLMCVRCYCHYPLCTINQLSMLGALWYVAKKTAYCSQNTLSSSYVCRMSSWITCIIKLKLQTLQLPPEMSLDFVVVVQRSPLAVTVQLQSKNSPAYFGLSSHELSYSRGTNYRHRIPVIPVQQLKSKENSLDSFCLSGFM